MGSDEGKEKFSFIVHSPRLLTLFEIRASYL